MNHRSASMPHTGIATFCKAPYQTNLDELAADIAVFGIPYDGATAMRPGSRQAPRAIRDASTRFGFLGKGRDSKGFFDINADKCKMEGIKIVDCGDVDVMYFKQDRNFDLIYDFVQKILKSDCLPVVLGGDHSISYPVIRAYDQNAPLTIILFDAHLDYRDEIMDLKYTNNSPFRRAKELDFVKQIISFGIRGIKSTDRDLRESMKHGNLVFSNYDVFEKDIEDLLNKIPKDIGDYYISIDIDGLDPSIAPGTESPEAEGLTFTQIKRISQALAKRGRLVGLDVVEVNPYLDHSEMTQHMAVQLLIEIMATRF